MPRRYTQIPTHVWDTSSRFVQLSREDQGTYMQLWSQANLSAAGVLPLTVGRWAGQSADGDETALRQSLMRLHAARWILLDRKTEEVWLAGFIADDGGYTNSKRRLAIIAAAREVASAEIRRAIQVVFGRLGIPIGTARPPARSSPGGRDPDPHGTATEPTSDALSDRASDTPSDRASERQPPPTPTEPAEQPIDALSLVDRASDDPWHTASDAPSDMGRVVVTPGLHLVPTTHNTQPPPPAPEADEPPPAPPWPGQEGEGEATTDEDTARVLAEAALADQIHALRPAWPTKAIRRALRDPDVRERTMPLVAAAALLVAQDPDTTSPGRLRAMGTWWARAEQELRAAATPVRAAPTQPPAWRQDYCGWATLTPDQRRTRAMSGAALARQQIAARRSHVADHPPAMITSTA